jgi:hypothetical protein
MNIFKKIGDFFLCMLREDCKYSIKKFLSYVFSALVLYMAIFTNKDFYEILMFVAVLLGIRSYERLKSPRPTSTPNENPGDEPLLAKKKVLTD